MPTCSAPNFTWYIAEGKGDYLHTNSIDVGMEGDPAARLPFAAAGQVLLSMREIGAIALLDLEREQIVWALRGSWLRKHDADLLADGDMLLFDNEGGEVGTSRVLEFDPTTLEITWSYAGDDEHGFYSRVRSGPGASAQRQYADHQIRWRPPIRGDARGRDRVGASQPRARRRRCRRADPDRLLGPAHRSRGA